MSTNYKFACIIISHGRPDNIPTLLSLSKSGYSGDTYVLIDDEDKFSSQYIENHHDKILMFNKQKFIDNNTGLFDKNLRKVAVHARNAAESIVKNDLKLDYYLLLDDDIINFHIKYIDNNQKLSRCKLTNLDDVIQLYISYMQQSNIATIGLAHEGMFLGGSIQSFINPSHSKNRILANAFLRNMRYDIVWGPDMCEDFITSINENNKAHVWMTLPFIAICCKKQGMNKSKIDGGNSEVYINSGNYGVAKYAFLSHPDSYKISKNVWFECKSYDFIVPKILSDKYKIKNN